MRLPERTRSSFRPRILLAASIGALALGAACADRGGETGSDERDSASAPAPGTPAAAPAGTVPPAIEALGHHAENAYDMARTSDWPRARASVDSLRSAIDSLPTGSGPELQAARTTLQELDRAVAARSRRPALVAANRLTELGARLASAHAPLVPAEVTLLDYYGRELEIRAAEGDLARLRVTGDSIRVTWAAVKPRVEQRGGTAEAAAFEALVQKIGLARTAADFGAVATPVLDEVDRLEAVFTR